MPLSRLSTCSQITFTTNLSNYFHRKTEPSNQMLMKKNTLLRSLNPQWPDHTSGQHKAWLRASHPHVWLYSNFSRPWVPANHALRCDQQSPKPHGFTTIHVNILNKIRILAFMLLRCPQLCTRANKNIFWNDHHCNISIWRHLST